MSRPAMDVDVAVIGAGVVGLAAAVELARRGRSVAVLERNARAGQETSSRHSGVIHAGIYYPTGSLKARLCVAGRRALVAFCARHRVPHRLCGKLILAVSPDEEATLEGLLATARANGVEGIRRAARAEVRRRQPAVRAAAALWSAGTGIVDAEELVRALDRQLAARGGHLLCGQPVTGLEPVAGGWRVIARPARGEEHAIHARDVVNAAGLWAPELARAAGLTPPRQHLCKGVYFWTPRPLADGLIYPVPEAGLRGLGIHATVDLGGRLRFGPDTEYVARIDYGVDPDRAAAFERAVVRYLLDLVPGDLRPDTAGIRPKLAGPGEGFADFAIDLHGEPGGGRLLSLYGIESPGLTASLGLGAEVAARLGFGPPLT